MSKLFFSPPNSALSFLAATSLFEDKYGVVQRDLGHILSTLLELQQVYLNIHFIITVIPYYI